MPGEPDLSPYPELYLPHLGWLVHETGDAVARYLNEGWFEFKEQAFAWLYLREGDAVLDCGSHFGLYAALAVRVMGRGTVLAVEANPETVPLLRLNLERQGTRDARVIQKAVSSKSGAGCFYPAREGRAAYSSLIPETAADKAVPVQTITLDELLAEHALARVDFTKIDVEGAEIEVLRGAAGSIREGRLPLILIECTEANLKRAGSGSRELFEAAQAAGYEVYQFDPGELRLVPRLHDGPVWYENLFLARHVEAVNERLAAAAPAHLRIAREILERGSAAAGLYRQANEACRALEQVAVNLRPYLASRYVRFGWQLKLLHKPVWLLRFVERGTGRD